jgi:LytS/YehU family sensor histidine kinase
MLMVPCVENCFKHSLNSNDEGPRVHIDVGISNERVRFTAENSREAKSPARENPATGLGLENLRRRLALLYPERHRLSITQEDDVFKVEMDLWL